MDEEGRCSSCAAANYMPGDASNLHEKDVIKSEGQQREELKELIKTLMKEIMEEKEATKVVNKFKPKECTECGETFQPRSPNQQRCNECVTK
jgi:hypothetical protein